MPPARALGEEDDAFFDTMDDQPAADGLLPVLAGAGHFHGMHPVMKA